MYLVDERSFVYSFLSPILNTALLQSYTHVLDMEYSVQVDEQICLLFTVHHVYILI